MSDRVDKDLRIVRAATKGKKWLRDCTNRVFLLEGDEDEGDSANQIGEMFCDADSKLVVWAGNRGVAYVELAQELEVVVLPQLEMALERVPDACKEQVLGAKYYVEQLLRRIEQ